MPSFEAGHVLCLTYPVAGETKPKNVRFLKRRKPGSFRDPASALYPVGFRLEDGTPRVLSILDTGGAAHAHTHRDNGGNRFELGLMLFGLADH